MPRKYVSYSTYNDKEEYVVHGNNWVEPTEQMPAAIKA